MKKNYVFETEGTCSRNILLTVEDGILVHAEFVGGCSGNTQGIVRLAQGQKVEDVRRKLEGIRCGSKPTSCPDQLATALRMIERGEPGGRLQEV